MDPQQPTLSSHALSVFILILYSFKVVLLLHINCFLHLFCFSEETELLLVIRLHRNAAKRESSPHRARVSRLRDSHACGWKLMERKAECVHPVSEDVLLVHIRICINSLLGISEWNEFPDSLDVNISCEAIPAFFSAVKIPNYLPIC